MKTTLELLCVALALISTTMATDASSQLATANGQFAKDVYKILSKEPGNVFFSPLSAHAALCLLHQGAGGSTKDSLNNALHVTNPNQAAEGYDVIINDLNNIQNATLLIANKVYVKDGYKLNSNYQNAVVQKLHSEVEGLDFAKPEAVKTVNSWVSDKTNKKIPKLFDDGDLDEATRLVLVNAIYFKGTWEFKFNPVLTKKEQFYVNANTNVEVDMMHNEDSYVYKEDKDLDAQILELGYTNEDLSMVVILPNKKDGISDLEAKLANVDFSKITEGAYTREVFVALPKFKIETTIDLRETLEGIGLGNLYVAPDLTGILENREPLVVGKAVQKAYIEVNEEGAIAAAATGLGAVYLSVPPKQYNFRADHPFLVILKRKQDILFLGRICKP